MRKGRRTRLAIGLALLFLLMASLLVSEFLARGASGLPGSQPGSSQLTTSEGNDQGEPSGPAGGAAGASKLAFTHDFDGVDSLGASGSRDDYSTIVGGQPGSEPTAVGDLGPAGGSVAAGGSGNSSSHDPSSGDPRAGAAPIGGYGGPFWGGGGTGGSGGPGGSGGTSGTGGPSGWSGSGGSSGADGFGGPGGKIHKPALFFTGTELGGGEGGDPSHTAPIPTSVATVPGPPTIILVVAGVGLLWSTRKLRRARCR